ncbi:nucleoside 2-deoxyribosyltransferase [Enterococcus xiangfangensis]|uniref:Nucleoside 2-deoxyribosyltransferase n=1 Tax=Enterococcus xiangfangensis TaxID=1296537 RepID=A0ABU3F928_9ENTE|nr:nucleoside 2-deoxyribosyltransferase [Enterococcus xiangfangensis]MDT2759174.1 nucleoside 2-deoxyribosyltransferase [Enterococcus xiangfangensis]NBK07723.1 nucleoside 2-deoxyribosyltransferase [Enterococcus asini]
MKIYLAGPFFSEEQIALIQSVEKALDNNPTVTEFHSPRLDSTSEYEEFTPAWANETYLKDMHHIETADCIVALLDYEHGITDPGTAYEIGIATMLKIPVIGLLTSGDTVNIMLTESLHAFTKQISDIQSYDFNKLPRSSYQGNYI